MSTKKDIKVKSNFNQITISLASPEEILERSSGEVLKPETVNYRTYKPERDGLFCERIFGPYKDYECHCGKYKRIRYRGIICDRCGVEVTEKKVRRERMGHISLTVPVAHIWYFRSTPNKIGYLLGIPSKKLEAIIYYERYIVIQSGIKKADGVKEHDFLTEDEYMNILDSLPRENQLLDDNDPNKFMAGMGAEAIYKMLGRIDLDQLSYDLRHKTENETSQQRKAEALKRLSVVEAFRESKALSLEQDIITDLTAGDILAKVERQALSIKESANSVILVHNHPSGDPNPSQKDIEITKKIFEAGELLGINVLDHVIIGDESYWSYKENRSNNAP